MGQLVSSVLSLGGGLISGSKAADAAKGQADALRAAGQYASNMARFNPYGMTTAFGTSTFDKGKGSYVLSPELKAIQDRLFSAAGSYDPTQVGQYAQPIYGGASNLFNLGQQYLAKSPEEAAQEYMAQQRELMAPGYERALADIRNKQQQTGRAGLATGGTVSGMAATNPEMAAYYNAITQREKELAAESTKGGMERTKFGAGLFGTGGDLLGQVPTLTAAGYKPLGAQLELLGMTEKMGQQPFMLSQDLANQYSTAGARAGQLYLSPQQAAAQAYSQYQGYSPMGTFLSGAGSAVGGSGGGGSSWFNNLISSGGNANNSSYFGGSGGGWTPQADSGSSANLFSGSSAYNQMAGWSA